MGFTQNQKLVYSTKEVESLLSIGKTKLFELIRVGELRSFTIGNKRLIPRAELEAYVQLKMQEVA